MSKHKLVQSQHIQTQVHGSSTFGRFNAWLASKITNAVGSMPMAYAFCVLACISLPAAILTHSPLIIVAWIAQTFLQLVLLPIIMVGQQVSATASDARAETDHNTLMLLHQINQKQLVILQKIEQGETK